MSVRTMLYQALVHEVAGQMGWDPERLQANQSAQITRYLQRSYRICHQYADWPEAMREGEAMAVNGGVIPWTAGPTLPVLNMVRNVWAEDPAAVAEDCTPKPAQWKLGPAGIHLIGKSRALETVWVDYREESPQLTSLFWSAARTYQWGGLFSAAAGTDGHCYQCISPVPVIGAGLDDGTVWRRIDLLLILKEPTILHAYAASLEEEDQHSKAAQKRGEAEAHLEQEIMVLRHQSGQRKQYRPALP